MSPLKRCMGCEQPVANDQVLCGGSVCNTHPGVALEEEPCPPPAAVVPQQFLRTVFDGARVYLRDETKTFVAEMKGPDAEYWAQEIVAAIALNNRLSVPVPRCSTGSRADLALDEIAEALGIHHPIDLVAELPERVTRLRAESQAQLEVIGENVDKLAAAHEELERKAAELAELAAVLAETEQKYETDVAIYQSQIKSLKAELADERLSIARTPTATASSEVVAFARGVLDGTLHIHSGRSLRKLATAYLKAVEVPSA